MKRKIGLLALVATTAAAAYTVHKEPVVPDVVPDKAAPKHVLFVLIDTLRQDRVGAYGYPEAVSPNFDRLAQEGVLFNNCRSTSSWTKPAMASLLSGVGPMVHGIEKGGVADTMAARVPTLPGAYETFVELFQKNGFPTVGFSGNPHVSAQTGLGQGFDILRQSNQFGPGLANDFISWLDMPFFPDAGFFRKCAAKPENLLSEWLGANFDVPPEIEVTTTQVGVHFRPGQSTTGRLCFSTPLGKVPDQSDPFVLGLRYSLGPGTSVNIKTESGTAFRVRPSSYRPSEPSNFLHRLEADAGAVTMEICMAGQKSSFDVTSGFALPKDVIEDDGPKRWFGYLHLMNPHLPYRASPEHLEKFDEASYGDEPSPLPKRAQRRVGQQKIHGTDDFRAYRAHYDASIHEADDMLGRVVASLEAHGLLDDTLIIVTSDHGEEFLDHGGMSHGSDPYGELLRVPLLFHYPRTLAKGKRVSGPISLLDIYPTLVDFFDFATPENLQGTSLLPTLKPGNEMAPSDRSFVTTHTPMSLKSARRIDVMISGGLKLIVTDDGKGKESVELYDLTEDPGETTNLASDRAEDVERLRAELTAERNKQEQLRDQLGASATNVLLTPEDLEALQALGYLDPEATSSAVDG